jgi:hypothetical protein
MFVGRAARFASVGLSAHSPRAHCQTPISSNNYPPGTVGYPLQSLTHPSGVWAEPMCCIIIRLLLQHRTTYTAVTIDTVLIALIFTKYTS